MSTESDALFEKYKRDSGAVQIGGESPQTIEEALEWAKSRIPAVAIVGTIAVILLSVKP